MRAWLLLRARHTGDFPRALYAANGVMLIVYTSVAAVGYGSHGDRVASFLPDTLPHGTARTAVGLLLAFHTGVSYLLTAQPLIRNLHQMLAPRTADQLRLPIDWLRDCPPIARSIPQNSEFRLQTSDFKTPAKVDP